MPSEWHIYTNKTGSSNKFWKYRFSDDGKSVEKEWGRIGGRVDNQTKSFPSQFRAEHYVGQEVSKKLRKGYVEETAEQLQEQSEVAQTIGTRWKINRMEFLQPGTFGEQAEFSEEYYGSAGVFVEMLESWTKEKCYLLITKDEAKQYRHCNYISGGARLSAQRYSPESKFVTGVRKAIRSLQEAVEQALVKFAAVGTRALDMGFDTSSSETKEAIKLVAQKTGASTQVIEKFAAVGARLLEI